MSDPRAALAELVCAHDARRSAEDKAFTLMSLDDPGADDALVAMDVAEARLSKAWDAARAALA